MNSLPSAILTGKPTASSCVGHPCLFTALVATKSYDAPESMSACTTGALVSCAPSTAVLDVRARRCEGRHEVHNCRIDPPHSKDARMQARGGIEGTVTLHLQTECAEGARRLL